MNELMYIFRDSEVRLVIKDKEPWFVGKDICEALEFGNHNQVLSRIDQDEKGVHTMDTLGGKQELVIINEYGLYTLILNSRKPEAKEFKRWVTHEILPSIRKRGMYATEDITKKMIEDPQYMIELLQQLQKEREERKVSENKLAILTHVNKDYNATEIAKELGFRSSSALNADLQQKGIQFRQNGTWLLYAKYSDKGYVNIKQDILDNGKVIYHRRFTQLGREWLLDLYSK